MEIQAVKSHANGRKHKEQCKPISTFFIEAVIKSKQQNLKVVDTGSKGTSLYQLTLDQSLGISDKWKLRLDGLWNQFHQAIQITDVMIWYILQWVKTSLGILLTMV